ncbi:LysM peptidoglycan-binding domain-containing protein [Vogesella fluminis]|uniref:LysM domain-containing protein n=1 Tax=Vogesella fluminis TaxID=1069161 RepID=A0ABQ3HAX5_9NEIS|nr:LysM domain-containing protein [Vogesella fluminis]GHD75126.1 hypothetical protein GCM10011419_12450 [Vogesella fluminis]
MFKAIIPLILALGLSATAFADTLVLRPDAPPRYEVKRGDTLWDISGRYLTAPWKWPQLWDMNRDEVKNPHWIYPGNVLYLEMVDGKPRLRLDSSALRVVKLSPRVRTEQLDSAIPTIPARIIDPFLKRPLLIEDEASYLQSPKIIAGPDNRVILSTTDRAYSQGLDAGGLWQAYRLGRTITDPDSGEVLGHEATYGGDLMVDKLDEVSTLSVRKIAEEVLVGDHLLKSLPAPLLNYTPHEPPPELEGRIVTSYAGVNEIGQQFNVLINRGARDGVEVGHVFGVYRAPRQVSVDKKQQVILPSEKVGRLIVFRVFNKASYALVLDATQPILVKDRIAQP